MNKSVAAKSTNPRKSAKPSAARRPAMPASATKPATTPVGTAWAHTARFLTTASKLDQLPASDLAEIAFVGRSNAGKSTAINTLAQHRRLAFASRTPGRTQHINLFELGPKGAPDALFADLPGYGYAAVERAAKLRWQVVMADYLAVRRSLSGVVLMVDSRLGFTDLDERLLRWIGPRVVTGEVRLLVLLTKADKLTRQEAGQALADSYAVLGKVGGDQSDVSVSLFSALKKTGVADVQATLHGWVHAPRVAAPPVGEAAPGTVDGFAVDAPVDRPVDTSANTPVHPPTDSSDDVPPPDAAAAHGRAP